MKMFFVLLTFCFSMPVTMHAQVEFVATTDAKQVVTGQYFSVKFALKNGNGDQFRAPSFSGFQVVGGPSRSQMRSNINGQVSYEVSYEYTLAADKPGKFKIGSATIYASGETYKTAPLTIEVIKAAKQDANAANNFIVEATVDHDTGYVGQQITLKYTLFTRQNVRQVDYSTLPSFDGFFAQELNNYRSPTEQIVRDGVQYYSRVIKVIALFPQQRGKFTLDPARLVLGVSDGQRSNSFFFNTRLKRYNVSSNDLEIEILETPDDPPISYNGAVGDFFLGSKVDKKTVAMDDAVTLTLQIRGNGDGKFIEPPEQPYSDLFDIYDPNLLGDQTQVVDDKIQVTKTYEYLMIPKRTGVIKFNPELTFFNVDSGRYEKIYGQQYQVNVIKGSDRELADIEDAITELPIPQPVGKLYDQNRQFAFSWMHAGANGALLLGFIGLLLMHRNKSVKDNEDPALKRKRIARERAESKLATAKEALDENDITTYYVRLRSALQEYLANKTNQESSQLSKDDISRLLVEYNLEVQEPELLKIMQKGEQAIYASIAPGDEMEDYHISLNIVGAIEEELI